MARIRSIHAGMGESKDISKLSIEARYFFALLWCHLDDEGRAEWLPKKLVGAMYAYDEEVTCETLSGWLEECVKVGVLNQYEVEGDKYISCPKFKVYQKPQKAQASKIPPPPIPLQDDYDTTTVVVSKENGPGVGGEKELGEGKEVGDARAQFYRPTDLADSVTGYLLEIPACRRCVEAGTPTLDLTGHVLEFIREKPDYPPEWWLGWAKFLRSDLPSRRARYYGENTTNTVTPFRVLTEEWGRRSRLPEEPKTKETLEDATRRRYEEALV